VKALLDLLARLGGGFLDAYVVVDADRRVIAFNRHYHGMFPRAVARRLEGSTCCQYLALGVCEGGGKCLARRCRDEGAPLRFDEIDAAIEGEDASRRLIVSALPLGEEGAPPEGALIFLRDVSDAADVQRKYKNVQDHEAREKERLREEIVRKTKELMDANQELNRVQKELMGFKKGLFG
jgi:hypothetical protein